ncbi:alpha/beta hydrolase family protein [Actinoplanes sp. RD1]|uniref:alpha/beta hydrolase family protein n=1 Tax=Actinoplanes sp. RD1 TaxID=3064538 RepID=UPI0027417BD4|nr:lipase [Actinoplanes sp. RD1]
MTPRTVLAALAALALLGATSSATPAAAADLRPQLPRTTGSAPVGDTVLHLADPGRAGRELMVSLFYPASPAHHGPQAPYMLDGAAGHFDAVTANTYLGLGVPPGRVDWARIRTHVSLNAPADRRAGRLPVVLWSPGLGEPRTWSTTLVAALASAGYLVVTIDNTGESPEVEFPDGRLVVLEGAEPTVPWVTQMMATRVADTSFVLDRLAGVTAAGLHGRIDLSAIGMAGHSAGGFTAAAAMLADRRIDAGVNLDGLMELDPSRPGAVLAPVAEQGVDRPFLLMGSSAASGGENITDSPSWASFWAHSTGWKADFTLLGTRHASFTDAEVLLPQLAGPLPLDPAAVRDDIGTLDPALAVRTQNRYLRGFFDRFLRGHGGQFLDDPAPAFPVERAG